MSIENPDIAVALYDQHTQAENAVKALQRAGFDYEKDLDHRQGLRDRGTCHWLSQRGRSGEDFRQVWSILGWLDGSAVRFCADVRSHFRPYLSFWARWQPCFTAASKGPWWWVVSVR